MTDKATQALYRAWGVFAATPVAEKAPEAAIAPSEPPESIDLRPWGYAPGGYTIRCIDCTPPDAPILSRPFADKRAWRCEPCAVKAMLTLPPDVKPVAPSEPPQEPFTVERMGDGVLVRVTARPLTLLEAQDLTARLMIVTTPMWAATIPKERI